MLAKAIIENTGCIFINETNSDVTSGTVTFTFSNAVTIREFLLWNITGNNGIREFQLFADNNDDFSDGPGSMLGETFTANREAEFPVAAQRFSFSATTTQYVHLNILNNHGGSFLGIGKTAFEVPFENTPISGIIFLLGAGGINYLRLKKNS